MKKFKLIIIGLLYSLQSLSQQLPPVTEVMQITFPKGTEKLDDQQLKKLSNREVSEKMISYFHDHVYKKNSLLIYYLNMSTSPILKRSMETTQRQATGVLKLKQYGKITIIDTSMIIKVNNIKFLIIKYHESNNWYIRFTSDYDKNSAWINGFIEYKKPNEQEAQEYLHELLNGMHFRN